MTRKKFSHTQREFKVHMILEYWALKMLLNNCYAAPWNQVRKWLSFVQHCVCPCKQVSSSLITFSSCSPKNSCWKTDENIEFRTMTKRGSGSSLRSVNYTLLCAQLPNFGAKARLQRALFQKATQVCNSSASAEQSNFLQNWLISPRLVWQRLCRK